MGAIASVLRAWFGRRFVVLAVLGGAFIVLWAAPIRPGVVLGESMSPSFHSGQVFLMSRLGDASDLGLGDVVVLEVDGEPYLKRIRAIGGQTVWGLDSADVDGAPDIMASPFEAEEIRRLARARPGMGRVVNITIPPGHVFVMGDSERNSYDSRQFGAVPVEAIRGRVVVHRLFQLWGPEQSSSAVVRAGDPEKRAGR